MSVINTVWKSKKQILEGIKNSIFTNDTVEEISKERLSECNKCENIDLEGKSCVVPGTAPCCSLCGCCLHLATRSLSYVCKAGKWPTLVSEKDNVDISILLNSKERLNELLLSEKINQEEYDSLLEEIMSENSSTSMNARYKIKLIR